MSEELFRFAVPRPPEPVDPGNVIVFPTTLTLLRRSLFAALDTDDPRRRMLEEADEFLASDAFAGDPARLPLGGPLLELRRTVAEAEALSISSLERTIEELFGEPAGSLLQGDRFIDTRELAFDAILALWIRPRAYPRLLPQYAALVRTIDLVERVARRDASLDCGSPEAVLRRTIVLPPRLFPLPGARPARPPAPPPIPPPLPVGTADAGRPPLARLEREVSSLERAAEMVMSLAASDLEVVGGELVVSSTAVARLPDDVRAVLRERGLDPRGVPLRLLVARIEDESRAASQELLELEAQEAEREAAAPRAVALGATVLPAVAPIDGLTAPEAPAVPPGSGPVRPPIVMPLMKVLQQIKRYERGQAAHVENVMRSERRTRETRRLRRSEETFITEIERTTEQERDEQTTERNEMQVEVSRTLAEREKFNIGASISAGYGPIQLSTNTSFESETATEEARRTAVTLAREVAEKTAVRVRERTREQRSRTTIEEFEEKYQHGFDNTAGDRHISGLYQWLDKVYEVEIRNYGTRAMFNIEVPEPAAVFIHATTEQGPPDAGPRPQPFLHRPDQITPGNYTRFVHRYRVPGVEPPPAGIITLSVKLESQSQPIEGEAAVRPTPAVATEVDIPDGYSAIGAYVATEGIYVFEPGTVFEGPPYVRTSVGHNSVNGDGFVSLDFEGGPTPKDLPVLATSSFFGPTAYHLSFVVGVEIVCARTSRALEVWRLRTHEAIMQAYLQMETAYQDRLAALVAQQGVQIQGRNPLENEALIRGELQRAAITMITGQQFDHFSAILQNGGLPRIDIDEAQAEGAYVAFFSQAFEWENMTYVFRPYFWGRKSWWVERLVKTQDPDPIFAAFLRAGYCRIQLPCRPGFEEAVLAFLDTGIVPEGDPEGIASPEHVGIVEEIKASLGVTGPGELIESFEVRLPTTLHILRQTDDLPAWARTEDGTWVPVEDLPEPS